MSFVGPWVPSRIVWPSGVKRSELIQWELETVLVSSAGIISQTLIAPASVADASVLPSGENATV